MSAILIYDGKCPVCQRAMEWVRQRARAGDFEYVECQAEDRAARFPQVSEDQCMAAIQLVLPGGEVRSGDDAMAAIFARLPRWKWLSRFLKLPGIRAISPRVYALIARNRHAISGLLPKKASVGEGPHCRVEGPCD